MLFASKRLASLVEGDLQSLVLEKIPEGKFVDYKEQLPGGTDSDKKEFVADITSFANASGGHLIFGVKEEAGLPVELVGVTGDCDKEMQRLENLLRGGLDPRLPSCSIRTIPLASGKSVIVCEVGRSWASPHMVTLGGGGKFYSRNSVGKYQLDVRELRTQFIAAESAGKMIREFRIGRLGNLVAGETPVPLFEAPKMVLHLTPLVVGQSANVFDLIWLQNEILRVPPIYSTAWGFRHNFDGFLSYSRLRGGACNSYVQVFRDGSIEAVESFMLRSRDGEKSIPSISFEEKIMEALPKYLSLQKDLGVSPPVFLMLSLVGVKDYHMGVSEGRAVWGDPHLIDRDTLAVPEVLIEDFSSPAKVLLKPIFDIIWNAAGWPSSINFDESGEWHRDQ